VVENPKEVARRGKRARADIDAHFSEASVAKVGAERLAVVGRRERSDAHSRARTRPPETKGHPDYAGLISRLRLAVEANTPHESTLAVVTRGDELLLDLGKRTAWHFPRNGDGAFAGYYPADSDAAVTHLEQLRANGAEYLVIPASCGWWLEFYGGMREHLETSYRLVFDDPRTGTIYALGGLENGSAPGRRGDLAARAEALEERIVELDRIAVVLDRRLQATLTWGGSIGDSLPAEVARLRAALADQRERTVQLEALAQSHASQLRALAADPSDSGREVEAVSATTSNGDAKWS
jgi:hypothetical protein